MGEGGVHAGSAILPSYANTEIPKRDDYFQLVFLYIEYVWIYAEERMRKTLKGVTGNECWLN